MMKVLKQTLATTVALCMLALSAFALDAHLQNDPKPPPKETKDVNKSDKQPPPPRNNNQNRGGNENKRGKP